MKAKLIYGLIISLLVSLSGGLYLYDSQKEHVVIEAENSGEVTANTGESGVYEEEVIVIYLTGAVVNPDIYEIPEASRLYELIDLAGGFREDAVKDSLNLARYVFDGEMIYVPSEAEQGAFGDLNSGGASGAGGKISINQGDLAELMTLTGIGETKAEAIIAYRKANGPFQRIEDIMKVDGIKDAMFNKIKDDITI